MNPSLSAIRARISRSPLVRRYLIGAGWSIAGATALSGISLLSMMFVARILGNKIYGEFVLIQSTIVMVGVLSGASIGATATRYVAELKSHDRARLSRILTLTSRSVAILGVISTAVLFLLSKVIASAAFDLPELAYPLSIAAISIAFSSLDGYYKGVLIGLEAMHALALGSILGAAAGVPIMLMAASAYGLNGVAGAMVASAVIQASISRFQLLEHSRRHSVSYNAPGCTKEWRVLRDFALPALFAGLLVAPAHWVCHTLLANTPNGFAELAVLGVATQWFNAIVFLPSTAGRVVMPILAERLAAGEKAQALKVLKAAILSGLMVGVPIALLVSLASPYVMAAYGDRFREGWPSLAVVSINAILVVGTAPIGQILAAKSRMWIAAAMNLGWAAIYIGLAVELVRFGALGIVVSAGAAYLAHSIWVASYAVGLSRQ